MTANTNPELFNITDGHKISVANETCLRQNVFCFSRSQ